jgi:hypothetical protein
MASSAFAGEFRAFIQTPDSRGWGDLRRATDMQAQPCTCRCAVFKFGPAWSVYRRPKLDGLRPEVDADAYLRSLGRNLDRQQAELASCDIVELRTLRDVLAANAIDADMVETLTAYIDGSTPVDLRTAEGIVRGFYAFVLSRKPSGLPDPAEQEQVKKYLSPQLSDLLATAWTAERACAGNTPPDLKPPQFEGAQFVGNHEGANDVDVGDVRVRGGRATVESRLVYVDERYAKAHAWRTRIWTDRLKLSTASGRWAIDDVQRAAASGRGRDSLAGSLRRFIDETADCVAGAPEKPPGP